MVKAILTKPLDGMAEGTEREFSQPDFDRLKKLGAVREVRAKKAPEVSNKKAPEVANKAAPAEDVTAPRKSESRKASDK